MLFLFMVSAGVAGTALGAPMPGSGMSAFDPMSRRMLMGAAMGLTAVCLLYSPLARLSGGHMNPAVTFTYWGLGKCSFVDLLCYVPSQILGGTLGVLAIEVIAGARFSEPPVSFVHTVPGPLGAPAAFVAEMFISFLLFSAVLRASNSRRLERYTGLIAGMLVALFIIFESPISGMSMNPARSLASAIPTGGSASLWIYFLAPPLGMAVAAMCYVSRRGKDGVRCANLMHRGAHCYFCHLAEKAKGRKNEGAKGRSVLLGLVVLLAVPSSVLASPGDSSAVAGFQFNVKNLSAAVGFYQNVLGFSLLRQDESHAELALGDERLTLKTASNTCLHPLPRDGRSNDRWFQHLAIVVSDMRAAAQRLRIASVPRISDGPQTLPSWNRNAAGIEAVYFRDPEGRPLELIAYPPGKGDARWQRKTSLFLGIDHSAIAVSSTAKTKGFLERSFGLRERGHSFNFGEEQERLSGVPGATVRITSFGGASGPGIELLEYVRPKGRPMPAKVCEDDLLLPRIVLSGEGRARERRDRDGHRYLFLRTADFEK